jgi:hypothetical protein
MTTITKILLVISLLLLATVPFTILFLPSTWSFPPENNTWNTIPSSDPDFWYRFIIIFTGLSLTVLALLISVIGLFIKNTNASSKLLYFSIFVFVFYIGWISLPYWTNGLYQVFSKGTSSMFDPKALLPMTIIGEFWRLPILLLYPFILLYLVFSFIRFIIVVIRRDKPGINNILILIFSLLTMGVQFLLPGYFYWLLD